MSPSKRRRNAATNATILPANRTKWDANIIQAEAIGRQAVSLTQTGDYVEFTTTAAANSIVVRYSIPDAPAGGGISATLGLYSNLITSGVLLDAPLLARLAQAGLDHVQISLQDSQPDSADRIGGFWRGWDSATGGDRPPPYGTSALGWLSRVHDLPGPASFQEPRPEPAPLAPP